MTLRATATLACALAFGVGAAMSGCAAQWHAACSELGYPEGTLEHAGCVERERDRFLQALDGLNQSLQQQNMINQLNRPRTCVSNRVGYSVVTNCY